MAGGAASDRRGNTIVLVAAILVLLVIIAAAYITRAQSQRTVSVATQQMQQRDDAIDTIGETIAQEIADSLFAWPIDTTDPAVFDTGIGDANYPRLRPDMLGNVTRHSIDPRFPYNHAPYETVPRTNWPSAATVARLMGLDPTNPDEMDAIVPYLPFGPGNPFPSENHLPGDAGGPGNELMAAILSSETNPLGNPGMGDARWLADNEPVRYTLPNGDEAFGNWRRMTNLARPNNNIRPIADISDVDRWTVPDLNLPVEQWPNLSMFPTPFEGALPIHHPTTGDTNYFSLYGQQDLVHVTNFMRQWRAWFGFDPNDDDGNYLWLNDQFPQFTIDRLRGHWNRNSSILAGGSVYSAPPNLFRLSNLRGDGDQHSWSAGNGIFHDRPESEFIPGTARHTVSRVLADASGDGYTDSFWFTAPTPSRNGVRQIMAARIVDNSAKLNPNVATQFVRRDVNGFRKTRGHTPADLALIGQLESNSIPTGPTNPLSAWQQTWNIGFYDNVHNWIWPSDSVGVDQSQRYGDGETTDLGSDWHMHSLWFRHIQSLGLTNADSDGLLQKPGFTNPDNAFARLSHDDRLRFWRFTGRHGIKNSAAGRAHGYSPFDLSDELSLRLFHGNNSPWLHSSFEHTTQTTHANQNLGGLLRSAQQRRESSEYLDQLTNRQLVRDNRRKLTLYSGARNDLLPPSLQRGNRFHAGLGQIGGTASRSKLDLREHWVMTGVHSTTGAPILENRLKNQLADTLLLALHDAFNLPNTGNAFQGGDTTGDGNPDTLRVYHSYYGPFDADGANAPAYNAPLSPLNMTRRLAGAYAANILAYRTNQPQRLSDAVRAPGFTVPTGSLSPGEVPGVSSTGGAVRYLGMEPQPFFVEAFVGHVYKARQVPEEYEIQPDDPDFPEQLEYNNAGDYFFMDDGDGDSHRSTIIVVQIANPFDVPIDLWRYRLKVFGNEWVNLHDVIDVPEDHRARFLPPATNDRPTTAIFYAMKETIGDDEDGFDRIHGDEVSTNLDDQAWRAFLDIYVQEEHLDSVGLDGIQIANEFDEVLPPDTMVVNLNRVSDEVSVSSRASYDSYAPGPPTAGGILLARFDPPTGPTLLPYDPAFWAVVDRFDALGAERFSDAVIEMDEYQPGSYSTPLNDEPPDPDADFNHPDINEDDWPNYYLGPMGDTPPHWVQWVRATRAWGVDLNRNGLYEAHERNPRYVFGDAAIVVPTKGTVAPLAAFGQPDEDNSFIVHTEDLDEDEINQRGGHLYDFDDPPNGDLLGGTPNPWFMHAYHDASGQLRYQSLVALGLPGATFPARKPTFFGLGWGEGMWEGIPANAPERRFFMPDKGWYGQFEVLALDTTVMDGSTFALGLVGGVLDPPFLTAGELLNFITDDGAVDTSAAPWSAASIPLVRQPFSMQMTMKNKTARVSPMSSDPQEWLGQLPPGTPPETIERLLQTKDFEQVGELLNVWLFGHELVFAGTGTSYSHTEMTFSEFMSGTKSVPPAVGPGLGPPPGNFDELEFPPAMYYWFLAGGAKPFTPDLVSEPVETYPDPAIVSPAFVDYINWLRDPETRRVNRLRLTPDMHFDPNTNEPVSHTSMVVNRAVPGDVRDPRHAWPALPAGARVLDAFVCDGPGSFVYNADDTVTLSEAERWHDLFGQQMGSGSDPIVVAAVKEEIDRHRFYNANAFAGRMTPGLINVNTATPEVMRAMPHSTRLVHEWWDPEFNPFSNVAESIVRYRDRMGAPAIEWGLNDWQAPPIEALFNHRPDYAHRGRGAMPFFFADPDEGLWMPSFAPGLRGERGFASVGELTLLNQPGKIGKEYDPATRQYQYVPDPPSWNFGNIVDNELDAVHWNANRRADYAGMPERLRLQYSAGEGHVELSQFSYLFADDPGIDTEVDVTPSNAQLSTDTVDVFDWRLLADPSFQPDGYVPGFRPDDVAEDVQESNLLFSGMSNTVTTRSDTFTVYLRVRTFRKNTERNVWDATDPEYIIDDSRYVMLVDRSEVNSPNDRPKILYMEKVTH